MSPRLLRPLLLAMLSAHCSGETPRWTPLPAIPDREGYAGSFAGVSHGALIVAGGSNFPERRPWEGGTKVWYDRVFVLESGSAPWRDAGHLPAANGYGVSITLPEGVLLVGGGDAQRNFAEVWLARWDGRAMTFTAWPALPQPLAQAAGALAGRTIYVAGGIDRPDAPRAQAALCALDLDHPAAGWRTLPPCPGGARILATAAAVDDTFYLFGGARLVTDAQHKTAREWLRDAWSYSPAHGWRELPPLPRAVVAAPTPAPVAGGRILILGGDDGAQVNVAPTAHRGFPRDVLAYDPAENRWSRDGELPFSLVTTTAARWNGRVIVAGGEQRPGVRSPAVWSAEP